MAACHICHHYDTLFINYETFFLCQNRGNFGTCIQKVVVAKVLRQLEHCPTHISPNQKKKILVIRQDPRNVLFILITIVSHSSYTNNIE